jgi:nucleoside-diphosphate-sugar epimerase
VLRGWPLPFAAVHNRRSMLFVESLADALLHCANHPAAANELFLVADGQAISTPALVRLIARQLGRRARLWPVPEWLLRSTDLLTAGRLPIAPLLDSLVIDSARIEQCLDWAPRCSIEEGLRATLATLR